MPIFCWLKSPHGDHVLPPSFVQLDLAQSRFSVFAHTFNLLYKTHYKIPLVSGY